MNVADKALNRWRSSMTATFMRSLVLLAALSVPTLAEPARGQDDDSTQIRQVIGLYFRGHATANADTMRAAHRGDS
jgi:hypothetical protein